MANLTETASWEAGIYRIETTDPVEGGELGTTNVPIKQLANRTLYLNELSIALKGQTSAIKHGVIACRNNAQDWDFMSGTSFIIGQTTAQVYASADDPFIAAISCGFDAEGHNVKYVYLTAPVSSVNDFYNPAGKLTVLLPDGTILCSNFVSYTVAWIAPTSPSTNALWYSLNAQRVYKYDGSAWIAYDCLVLALTSDDSVPSPTLTYYPTIGKSINDIYGRTSVPTGTVHTFAGPIASIPPGYLLCNGSAISRTTYSNLFQTIETTYGDGNTVTTFNIPDLRGEFIRGLDNSRLVDIGRVLGSAQADELESHSHNQRYLSTGGGSEIGPAQITSRSATPIVDFSVGTGSTGGSETRPRNIAMNFIIKF